MSSFSELLDRRVSQSSAEGGIADAVALIQSSAVKNADASKAVAIVPLPEAAGDYLIVNADGTWERVTPEPGPIGGYLYSVDEVARAVNRFQAVLVSVTAERVFVHTDEYRFEVGLECPLPVSDLWDDISERCGRAVVLNQRDLISWLRFDLAGCLDSRGDELLEWARRVSTTTTTHSETTIRSHQESLGRSVSVELEKDAIKCPEAFGVRVRIWKDRALTAHADVPFVVDYSPASQTFTISGNEVARMAAFDAELAELEMSLRKQVSALCDDENAQAVEVIGGAPWSSPTSPGSTR